MQIIEGNIHRRNMLQRVPSLLIYIYCHVPGLCDLKDRFWIWWSNLLDLYTTGYNSSQITSTGHSLSPSELLKPVIHCYITPRWIPRPLPSNGCLPYCCVFIAARCVHRFVTQQWASSYCWLRVGWNVFLWLHSLMLWANPSQYRILILRSVNPRKSSSPQQQVHMA